MSQKINYRRDGERHQDNGPTYEGGPPNSGSNSTHVARSRKKWKRRFARAERRTDGQSTGKFHGRKVKNHDETVLEVDLGGVGHMADASEVGVLGG